MFSPLMGDSRESFSLLWKFCLSGSDPSGMVGFLQRSHRSPRSGFDTRTSPFASGDRESNLHKLNVHSSIDRRQE